ncbi:MAG: dTDP-4-dehydrorhamnose 3,5-epimerase family protein, partial [Proteobacteria bacterium]|nr:dTDP-4-dehydrorhamnose 3,5-epimerase family protein [Pseudomonadota bacterium]
MKILEVLSLKIEDIKVIKFAKFKDDRGYFTEVFRQQDIEGLDFLKGYKFYQANESYSKANVIRGLHFQWNPYMGKLVRTIRGRMIDLALDIRKNSPTFGKIIAYDMPAFTDREYSEWIWIPPGFAHGNIFTEETMIEYFCTGWWSPQTEAGINPFAEDIDWSLCDKGLKMIFEEV